jgi:hypothetical protein
MPFLNKVNTKAINKKFLEDIIHTIENWVKTVSSTVSVVADVDYSLEKKRVDSKLMRMNNAINYLRKDLQVARIDYVKILKKQDVDPLSSSSLDEFPDLIKKLNEALMQARSIAYAYAETLKNCDKHQFNTTKYLTPKNKQAIDRLFNMTTDDLLSLIKDAHLLGF